MKWADVTIIDSLTQVRDAYANQGGSPSGDAAVTDVALGKTFDSATAGAGATGTSTKNATVPNDAPIQPPQAFVDASQLFVSNYPGAIDFSNLGITHIDFTWLTKIWSSIYGSGVGPVDINLSVNALSQNEINSLLAGMAGNVDWTSNPKTLNISGAGNASPSGQGLTDKSTLENAGWTITANP